jgi:hypothetical protein
MRPHAIEKPFAPDKSMTVTIGGKVSPPSSNYRVCASMDPWDKGALNEL